MKPARPQCRSGAVGSRVSYRELRGHIALQWTLRKRPPESFEHGDGTVPLLERDELRGNRVFSVPYYYLARDVDRAVLLSM